MWSERESWELLVPSLGVAFTSRASAQWRPEALPDDVRAQILSGLEARATIRRSYSELDSALYDLRHSLTRRLDHQGPKRSQTGGLMAKVTELGAALKLGGRLSEHTQFLDELAKKLEGVADELTLQVHGFLDVIEDRGTVTFRYELWGRKLSFTESQMRDFASMLEKLTQAARDRLRGISATT